jgi:23S rRNA (guanosine2251-2'-O)-methyltransferase
LAVNAYLAAVDLTFGIAGRLAGHTMGQAGVASPPHLSRLPLKPSNSAAEPNASERDMSQPPAGKPSFRAPPKGGWKPRPFRPAPAPEKNGPLVIFGVHAVEAALNNPARRVRRAFMTENAEHRLAAALAARGLVPERVTPRDLDMRLGSDTVHQGMVIEVEDLEEKAFKVIAREAAGRPLLVLDQVTDPHNVGAILRSAAVFGAAGLVMTERHSPPLGGVLAKSASGALELVPIVRVQNLARTLEDLKTAGFVIVGLDGTAETVLEAMAWPPLVAFVMGAEGKGLRELTAKTCDHIVRVTTDGPLNSLNVSNAAAIALHTAVLARKGMLGQSV